MRGSAVRGLISAHDPIIDREPWDSVQEQIKLKAKPFTIGTIRPFAQKARCLYCGYLELLANDVVL